VEEDSGAGITKEVPSKIHELHADAAELTPRRLQEVAYCQNREVTRKPEEPEQWQQLHGRRSLQDCPASRIVCGNTNKQKSVGNPADEIAIVRLDFKVFYGYWVLRIALRYAARVWPDDSQEIISHWRLGVFGDFWGSATSSWPQIANRPSGHPAQSPATHLESLKTHKSSKS